MNHDINATMALMLLDQRVSVLGVSLRHPRGRVLGREATEGVLRADPRLRLAPDHLSTPAEGHGPDRRGGKQVPEAALVLSRPGERLELFFLDNLCALVVVDIFIFMRARIRPCCEIAVEAHSQSAYRHER